MNALLRRIMLALGAALDRLDGLLRQWPVAGFFVLVLILVFASRLPVSF